MHFYPFFKIVGSIKLSVVNHYKMFSNIRPLSFLQCYHGHLFVPSNFI